MKKFLALSILLAALGSSFVSTLSWAEEDELNAHRTANPGDDPNGAKAIQEADVAAPGICKECLARLNNSRINAPTAYSGTNGNDGSRKTFNGTR